MEDIVGEIVTLLKSLDSVVAVALLLVIFWQYRLFAVFGKQLNQNTRAVAKMVVLLEILASRVTGPCQLDDEEKKP